MIQEQILTIQEIALFPEAKIILGVFVFVELILKGFALWRAAKRSDKVWYIAILVLNTLGLLPFIYLIITRKKDDVNKS